jgi:hypothetical protein
VKTARFKATAYHEAGHAFVAWYLGVKIESATIVAGDAYAGRIHHEKTIRRKNPDSDRTAVQMEKHIRVCLAGPIAQRIYDPRSCRTLHCHSDNQSAANIALNLYGSSKVATEFLKYLSVSADELLHQSWHMVKALANEFMSKRTMTGEEVKTFLVGTMAAAKAKRFRLVRSAECVNGFE